MSRGVNTIGVDISAEAIAKAKKNCSWLLHEWSLPTTAQCIVGDATQLSTMKEIQHIDAIATEPYLGTTKLGEGKITDAKRIKDIIKGLEYLYIGCLRDWQGILKPHARVVMAIPSYTIGDRTYAVKKVVDTCENLGYTKLLGPIQYGRPKSIVQRNFYIFERK